MTQFLSFLMTEIFDLLGAAISAIFIQNLIFCGGFGASETMSVAAKPKQIVSFAALISFFSTVTAVSCRLLDSIPQIFSMGAVSHIVIYVAVLFVAYIFVSLIFILLFGPNAKFLKRVGLAAFNTLILAIPILNNRAAYTISESIGMGIGAGLAFIVAVVLVNAGMRKVEQNTNNGETPKAFRGTPIVFIYISLLALAFTGISGMSLFV